MPHQPSVGKVLIVQRDELILLARQLGALAELAAELRHQHGHRHRRRAHRAPAAAGRLERRRRRHVGERRRVWQRQWRSNTQTQKNKRSLAFDTFIDGKFFFSVAYAPASSIKSIALSGKKRSGRNLIAYSTQSHNTIESYLTL